MTGNRQQASGNRQGVDELLLELGQALDVQPSADFEANVLARVGHTAPASSPWAWRWGFAAGALATVVLLTILVRLRSDGIAAPAADVRTVSNVAAPTITSAPSSVPPVAGPMTPPARSRAPVAIQAIPEVPHALIAPDQAAAVQSLLDRFARGNAPSTSLTEAAEAPPTLEIDELAPIPLIVITPLVAPPNGGGAGSRQQ